MCKLLWLLVVVCWKTEMMFATNFKSTIMEISGIMGKWVGQMWQQKHLLNLEQIQQSGGLVHVWASVQRSFMVFTQKLHLRIFTDSCHILICKFSSFYFSLFTPTTSFATTSNHTSKQMYFYHLSLSVSGSFLLNPPKAHTQTFIESELRVSASEVEVKGFKVLTHWLFVWGLFFYSSSLSRWL